MEKNPAIKAKNISKTFLMPSNRKFTLQSYFVNPFERQERRKFEALRDLTFSVNKGEFMGIIGPNGAGKSTLLKIIAGIYSPDNGEVKVSGVLVPFLELGVGFHPDLSAEENVYLNGIILGLRREEVDLYIDEIFEFAELKEFRGASIKNFSSGMQVRLAFSIAVRVRSDILLLDEVLAVGDSSFQEKCYKYFDKIKGRKTIVFVSHDLRSVLDYADRVLYIRPDKSYEIGDPERLINTYQTEALGKS